MKLSKALRRLNDLDAEYGTRTRLERITRRTKGQIKTAGGWLRSLRDKDKMLDSIVLTDYNPARINVENGTAFVVDNLDGYGILSLQGVGQSFVENKEVS